MDWMLGRMLPGSSGAAGKHALERSQHPQPCGTCSSMQRQPLARSQHMQHPQRCNARSTHRVQVGVMEDAVAWAAVDLGDADGRAVEQQRAVLGVVHDDAALGQSGGRVAGSAIGKAALFAQCNSAKRLNHVGGATKADRTSSLAYTPGPRRHHARPCNFWQRGPGLGPACNQGPLGARCHQW